MSVPTYIQTNTKAEDSSSASSHQIATSSALRAQGGAGIGPNTVIFGIVYDNSAGGIGTGVTGTSGATYTRLENLPNVANGFTLEVWEAHNVTGGAVETITWSGSASVKAKMVVAELDQVAPLDPRDGSSTPFDKSTERVDVTNSASRTSAASSSVKRAGEIDVFIGIIGWNDTRTISAAGSTWTGLIQINGGSTNLGIGIERKSAEVQNTAGAQNIARFTMSASGTVPAAVASLSFLRDGVITSTDEDGCIQNIEGAVTVDTGTGAVHAFWPGNGIYRSSSSAPNGGTGGSETDHAYAFFPKYNLPAGATIGSTFSWLVKNNRSGFDDGSGMVAGHYSIFKNGTFGTTLDSSDDVFTPNDVYIGLDLFNSFGLWQTISGLSTSSYLNQSGTTTTAITSEGDTGGLIVSNYGTAGDFQDAVPQYLVLTITYPSLSSVQDPVISSSGVVPFPR